GPHQCGRRRCGEARAARAKLVPDRRPQERRPVAVQGVARCARAWGAFETRPAERDNPAGDYDAFWHRPGVGIQFAVAAMLEPWSSQRIEPGPPRRHGW